jgi:hypothetical protein
LARYIGDNNSDPTNKSRELSQQNQTNNSKKSSNLPAFCEGEEWQYMCLVGDEACEQSHLWDEEIDPTLVLKRFSLLRALCFHNGRLKSINGINNEEYLSIWTKNETN